MGFDYFSKRLSRDQVTPSMAAPMAPRPANGLSGQLSPDNGRPPDNSQSPGGSQPSFPGAPPQTGPLSGVGPYASVSMFTIPPAYRYHPLGMLTRDFNPSMNSASTTPLTQPGQQGQPNQPMSSGFNNAGNGYGY